MMRVVSERYHFKIIKDFNDNVEQGDEEEYLGKFGFTLVHALVTFKLPWAFFLSYQVLHLKNYI